jgi:hypothetical protein
MSSEIHRRNCYSPNFFSEALTPTIERSLPRKGSIASRILDHSTKLPTFLQTVSQDLCDDGRMSGKSGRAALGFITRSSTTALVIGGGAALGGLAIATAGAPAAVAGLGLASLAVLPPLVEWGAQKATDIAGSLLSSFKEYRGR